MATFWLFSLCASAAYMIKGRASYVTQLYIYIGAMHTEESITMANILKIMKFLKLSYFALFEFKCTVCSEIHVTMNYLCWLYCCVRFIYLCGLIF